MSDQWLVPSIVVAASGLALQGLKAGWDLYIGIATQRRARLTLRLQEVSAVIALIDALPIDQARKAVRKSEIIRSLRENRPMTAIHEIARMTVEEV
jgi:hypothetical protein